MTAEPASGILEKVFVKEQVFDTFVAFVSADAVAPVKGSFKLEPEVTFEKLKEAVGTASLQTEVQLNRGGKWSGSFYIRPQSLGTPPDIGPALLKAAMGVETLTGSTSAAYTLSDIIYTPLQFMHVIDGHWSHFASGAWVEEMKINVPANGLVTVDFSGGFARMGWCYRDDIAGAEATGQTEIGLDDASIGCVQEPAMCEFTGDDGAANAGYLITGHDWTSGSAHFDISPGIQGAGLAGGAEILPFVLAQTLGDTEDTPITGISNTFTIGSVSPGFINFVLTVQTGLGPRDREAGSDRPVGICRVADRVVEAEVEMWFKDTSGAIGTLLGYAHDGLRNEGPTYDVDLTVGSISTHRMKINMPKTRLDVAQFDTGGILTAKAKMVAHQSAAAADELDLLFD